MKKKKEKYIVYLHQEYLNQVCKANGIETMEEIEDIRHQVFDQVNRFLRGEATQSVLMCDTFTNSKGETTKSIEIYNLKNGPEVKNLKELQQLIAWQKRRGFEEFKKK